ncbi:AAA family ATPase, partial [Burkholderia sp. SIMBA_048]
MIESIQINAFKSFRSCETKLGRLTVLAGLNNSGKSSLMQAIRMCIAA